MKRFFPIIIGVMLGVVLGLGLVLQPTLLPDALAQDDPVEEDSGFDFSGFEWKDLFGPSEVAQDYYYLTYDKLVERPQADAIKAVAGQYGLTIDETDQIINGAGATLFNNPRGRRDISQQEAFQLIQEIQRDFEDLKELYQLEQEIDVELAPSEIFANGDLSDSGFDLVHDLEVIEEILFVNVTENTVGEPFDGQLSEPFLPTEIENEKEFFIGNQADVATIGFGLEQSEEDEEEGVAVLNIGEREEEVEVLEFDICEEPGTSIEDALADFEEQQEDDQEEGVRRGRQGLGLDDEEEQDEPQDELAVGESALVAAPAGEWGLAEFCPGIGQPSQNNSFGTFGDAGFTSLSERFDNIFSKAPSTGAVYQEDGFEAHVAICLNTELIFQTLSSYNPGDSCILCEIERINETLDRTLSHSLIPNKVTGNLYESAKCKEAYQALLDINFIVVDVPIPTPPNDDLILGNNIFEEWNKFVERYHPFLEFQPTFAEEFVKKTEFAVKDQQKLLNDIDEIQAKARAEAVSGVQEIKLVNDGTNALLYSQTVLQEMKQMTALFEKFKESYEKLGSQVCSEIAGKPNIN